MPPTYSCSHCHFTFIVPKRQRVPTRCGNCTRINVLSLNGSTWNCLKCSSKNGIDKKECQKCLIQRHTQKADRNGVRSKPDGNLHTLRDTPRVKVIVPIVTED